MISTMKSKILIVVFLIIIQIVMVTQLIATTMTENATRYWEKNHVAINSTPSGGNNKITLLFIAGIEGSGHHLWLHITNTMSRLYPSYVTTKDYPDGILSSEVKNCFVYDLNSKEKLTGE
eukprot:406318_1